MEIDVVFIVEVVDVVVVKGCRESTKSSLTSVEQKYFTSRVVSPLVCSPSPYWLVPMTKSSVTLGVVDGVIVVEVNVRTEVVSEPLEPKWLTKV